jgi:hypothetical protein
MPTMGAPGLSHGIQVHCGKPRPDGLHVFDAGGAGIMQLASQDQIGLTVDDELRGASALLEVRGSLLCAAYADGADGEQCEQN